MGTRVIHGSMLGQLGPPEFKQAPAVNLPGLFNKKPAAIKISKELLSKHFLVIGGTGSGKTNLFYFFVDQLRRQMTDQDVMVIFDAKGDYYEKFNRENDLVISSYTEQGKQNVSWNTLREIAVDGWSDSAITLNAQEIARSFFREAVEKNNSQPFFPNAARDLLAAIFVCLLRQGKDNPQFVNEILNNESLKRFFERMTAASLHELLINESDLGSVLSYIGDGSSEQALGVLAELQNVVRELFVGAFARKGTFSIRNFIRKKGKKTLFIEYDLSIGSSLTPIYRLLFDLALKEALGRRKSEGSVYLICDEFKLLPNSQHIEDGVNFGRSLGVKIIAGLQSIEQLVQIYGESQGRNIAAGFSSVIAFRANDRATRDYISGLYGKNMVLEQYSSLNNNIVEEKREGRTIEDWDMCSLAEGEAVVGLSFHPPFRFQFDLFR